MDILKIFISSVFDEDFKLGFSNERKALSYKLNHEYDNYKDVSLDKGHASAIMGSEEKSLERIEKSDLMVLFIGTKYGRIRRDDLSLTHIEYRYAKKNKKNMLIYVFPRDENHEDSTYIHKFLHEIYSDDIYISKNIQEVMSRDFDDVFTYKKNMGDSVKIKPYCDALSNQVIADILSVENEIYNKINNQKNEVLMENIEILMLLNNKDEKSTTFAKEYLKRDVYDESIAYKCMKILDHKDVCDFAKDHLIIKSKNFNTQLAKYCIEVLGYKYILNHPFDLEEVSIKYISVLAEGFTGMENILEVDHMHELATFVLKNKIKWVEYKDFIDPDNRMVVEIYLGGKLIARMMDSIFEIAEQNAAKNALKKIRQLFFDQMPKIDHKQELYNCVIENKIMNLEYRDSNNNSIVEIYLGSELIGKADSPMYQIAEQLASKDALMKIKRLFQKLFKNKYKEELIDFTEENKIMNLEYRDSTDSNNDIIVEIYLGKKLIGKGREPIYYMAEQFASEHALSVLKRNYKQELANYIKENKINNLEYRDVKDLNNEIEVEIYLDNKLICKAEDPIYHIAEQLASKHALIIIQRLFKKKSKNNHNKEVNDLTEKTKVMKKESIDLTEETNVNNLIYRESESYFTYVTDGDNNKRESNSSKKSAVKS